MSQWVSKAGQRLSDLAWRAYEHSPQPLADAAGYLKPYMTVVRDWRVPLNIFYGPVNGTAQASLLVAGAGNSIQYVLGRFFTEPPHCQAVGTVALSSLSRTLRRMRGSVDVTVAEVPRPLAGWISAGEYLHVPPWVGAWLSIPENLEGFARQNKPVWEELRLVRHNDLKPCFSKQISDFDRFYHEMYLPYAMHRFGENALVRPLRQMRRLLRCGGTLMWICRQERQIAGALFWPIDPHCMGMISLGLAGTGDEARKTGAIAAIYYFGLEHAKARGCTVADFGACRPSPADGVTWFKRKWGVHLRPRPKSATDLLLRWEHAGQAARSFLSRTPLIIQQGCELSLIVAPLDQDRARARHLHWMHGLQRMYVFDENDSNDSLMPGLSLAQPEAPKSSPHAAARAPIQHPPTRI